MTIKHYPYSKHLSHSIYPDGYDMSNLPPGALDPADEYMTEDEFEAERERKEQLMEDKAND